MRQTLAVMLCLLLCSALPASADDTGTDPSIVVEKYVQHFVVNPDGSYVLTIDNVKSMREQRALQAHGQYYISYNRTLDEVLAVEAYTEKPDGRRIAVQPAQIHDQQESASTDAPMFQDTRMKVVVFPEVAVGDRLAVHYVIKRATPLFPGQFEDLSSSQFFRNEQFHLIYDMPASMPLYADAVGFMPVPIDSPPGRLRYHWQYQSGDNARIEAESVSYLDYGKRLSVATFADYASFARAYQERAAAGPLDAGVAELARSITASLSSPRAKALALSDWIRRNVRYVAVYVGPGGVVPHAAATVLENRYGDCKDHASLLEAMLAAVGIDSTPAMINSGSAYRLPRIPTLGVFNHIITYIPALDLYLDSTAEPVAAGYLPPQELGKPTLLTKTGAMGRTPASQPEKSRNLASFTVNKDGSSRFVIARTSTGAIAEPYRHAVRGTRQVDRDMFVQRMLQGFGQKGVGVFDPGKLDGSGDEYRISLQGTSENFLSLPGPTGMGTLFNFWGGLGDAIFSFVQEKERSQDFICPPADVEDESTFAFARGVGIVALPQPVTVYDRHFNYRAQYMRSGSKVVVRRRVTFRHDGMVCTPQEFKEMQASLDRIIRDLKSQVIVKAL